MKRYVFQIIMKSRNCYLFLLFIGLAALDTKAQSPSNTYNWDVVFSGSATTPPFKQWILMSSNVTVVIHNNGTNAFTPSGYTLNGGTFSGSSFFGLDGGSSGGSNLNLGSIAASASGTATISPRLALRATGTGVQAIKSSVHALTVAGCDDVVFLSFNAYGSWTVTGTGALNVTNATWSPTGPTMHVYREGPGSGGRTGTVAASSGALDLQIDIGNAGP